MAILNTRESCKKNAGLQGIEMRCGAFLGSQHSCLDRDELNAYHTSAFIRSSRLITENIFVPSKLLLLL